MKKWLSSFVLFGLMCVSACSSAIPEPPELPQAPPLVQSPPSATLREHYPLPDLLPAPVFLSTGFYQPKPNSLCLIVNEAYHQLNVGGYFSAPVSDLLEDILQGLGYQVYRTMQPDCELVTRLDFDIELISSTYSFQGLKNTCFTGVNIEGMITVQFPSGDPRASFRFGESQAPPGEIDVNQCYQSQANNPLLGRWRSGFVEGLVDLWGTNVYPAILGAGWPERHEDLQREAYNAVDPASASSMDPLYVGYALANQYSYQLLKILALAGIDQQNSYLIPIILENMIFEAQAIKEARQSLIPLVEIELLSSLQPGSEFVDSALPAIIINLAVIYRENDEYLSPAVDLLAGLGPGVIPVLFASAAQRTEDPEAARTIQYLTASTALLLMQNGQNIIPMLISYLYYHPGEDGIFGTAASGLDHLVRNGYRNQVAEQAGHPLIYLLFRMEKGEIPADEVVRGLLNLLFPEIASSTTRSSQYFKSWQSEFGSK